MPPISQGRKQWVVSTETLLAWKRFQRERPGCTIDTQDGDGALFALDDGFLYRISGKHVEEVG